MHSIIKLLIVVFVICLIAFAGFLYWFYSPLKGTELEGYVPVTGDKYVVIVTGDDYGLAYLTYLGTGTDRFDELGKEIKTILENQYNYDEVYLETTREGFLSTMNSLNLKKGDQLSVILLAHGGQLKDGSDYAIWIDKTVTATEINNSLSKFEDVRLFVFVASCGSGKFIEKITAVNRVIMTSGAEENTNTGIPVFNFVSELFNFVKAGIEKDYNENYRRRPGADVIQIDDNADGRSTHVDLPSGSDGYLAIETFF